jgi:hypothetical protein
MSPLPRGHHSELSVAGSSVLVMETTRTTRALHVVRPQETPGVATLVGEPETEGLSVEDYWARVQELRAVLARLRPAN